MGKKKKENQIEELLKRGASLAAEEMGNEAQEDTIEFSEKHKSDMEKIFVRERRKLRIKRGLTYTARIAAVLVIVAAMSGLAIFRVDALRIWIWNVFTRTEPTNTEVRFNEGETYWAGNISLGYIPEGFEISREKIADDTTFLKLKNGEDFFDIFIRDSYYDLSLDTEDAGVTTVNLNGREALYSEKDGTKILAGYLEDKNICLTGNINKNTLYKIYQNIEFN